MLSVKISDSPCRSKPTCETIILPIVIHVARFQSSYATACQHQKCAQVPCAAELRFTKLGVAVDILLKLPCLRRPLVVFKANIPHQTIVGCCFQCCYATLKLSEPTIQVLMHEDEPAYKPILQLCSRRVGHGSIFLTIDA